MAPLQIAMERRTGSGSGHMSRADLFRRLSTLQSPSAAGKGEGAAERADSKGPLLSEPQMAKLWRQLEGVHCWHPSNPSGHYRLLLDHPVRVMLTCHACEAVALSRLLACEDGMGGGCRHLRKSSRHHCGLRRGVAF